MASGKGQQEHNDDEEVVKLRAKCALLEEYEQYKLVRWTFYICSTAYKFFAYMWDYVYPSVEQNNEVNSSSDAEAPGSSDKEDIVVVNPPTPKPTPTPIYVPRKLYLKSQHKLLLDKLLKMCKYDPRNIVHAEVPNHSNFTQVVPCIIASRAGSDLAATFEDAGLDRKLKHDNVIIIMFAPKAPFVPENLVSSFEKMGDEFRVKDIVDVVFFDDEIYSCHTNNETVKKMEDILA